MTYELYLDPENQQVFITEEPSPSSMPESAYHGRTKRLLTITGVRAKELSDALLEYEEELVSLCELYKGSQWNGSNWIGSWDESFDYLAEKAMSALHLKSRVDADFWLEGYAAEILYDWRNGATPEEIVEGLELEDYQSYCTREDAVAYITSIINDALTKSELSALLTALNSDGATPSDLQNVDSFDENIKLCDGTVLEFANNEWQIQRPYV